MGVLYSVFPIDAEMVTHLVELGVANQHTGAYTRNPTPAEVRVATKGIPEINSVINESSSGELLQIELTTPDPETGPWTLINVEDYEAEHLPCRIWFEKGWPGLILEVLIRITRNTGPLVVVPDTGESPVVVLPTDSMEALIESWDHTQRYQANDPEQPE